ncbi:MAG: DegT/DnrJ/EryC1/StrS family aminotransferase, partial [Candidatus Omnitrophica bacterium]|nr:DegT/DnrJ/EryC1/StrS family aminotransferase [Candidatus Omnitrophota bacterium]
WLTQGPQVQNFEEAFAKAVGARYGVAVSSCTTGLHLALIAAGVGPGDEVICPSFTFIATANVIRYCGAKPVFIDIDPKTYNLDPSLLKNLITSRTKAVIAVHQVGLPADMGPILEIAEARGIKVLEDAACAIGAEYRGERIGKPHGFLAVFSFHPRKIITTGEGGMLTTNDESLATRLKQLRHHGMSVSDLVRHQAKTVVIEEYRELGYNYRMSDLQAAVGLAQLDKLDDILGKRIQRALRYHEAFGEIESLEPPYCPASMKHTYQSYILRVKPNSPISRDDLMNELLKVGIASRRGIMAIHREPLYAKDYADTHLAETDAAVRETLILPLFAKMTDEEQDYVISHIKDFMRQPV